MNQILYQMNTATAPGAQKQEPVRLIGNYFSLLTTMMKLGLQLIWERQNGLKHFIGIMDNEKARAMYDDIIRCVMRPEAEDSEHFAPQEIDGIAEVLSKRGMKTADALDYLRIVIAVKLENEALQGDGDTHQPLAWAPLHPHTELLEFRDHTETR